eukprot:g18566.t1
MAPKPKGVKKGNDKSKTLKRSKTDEALKKFTTSRPEIGLSEPMVEMEARTYIKTKNYHMQNILRDFDEHRPSAEPLRTAMEAAPTVAVGDNATQKAEWLAFSGDLSAYHATLESCSDTDVEKWEKLAYDRAIKRGEELLEASVHWPSLNKMTGFLGSSRIDFPLPAADRRKFAKILVSRVVKVCKDKRAHKKRPGQGSGMVVEAVGNEGELVAAQKNEETGTNPAPVFATVDDIKAWLGKCPEITTALGGFYTKMVDQTPAQFSTTISGYLVDPNNAQTSAGWKLAKALEPFVDRAAAASTSTTHGTNLGKLSRGEAVSDAEKKACKEHTFTTHEILRAIAPTPGKIFSLLGAANRVTMINKLKTILKKVQIEALQAIDKEFSMIEQKQLKSGRLSVKHHVLNIGWSKQCETLKLHCDAMQLSAELKQGQQDEWQVYSEAAEKYVKTGTTTAEQTNLLKSSATITSSYVAAHASVVLLCKPKPTELEVTEVIGKVKDAASAMACSSDHIGAMQHLGDCIQLWQKRQVGALFVNTKSELSNMLANQAVTQAQVLQFYAKWKAEVVMWKMWQIDMPSLNGLNTWLQDEARAVGSMYKELKETVDARSGVAAAQPAAAGVMKMDEGGDL